jgi:hypothetical protein
VVETLERIREGLPFALRALDVDNGTEFVNDRLIEYCLSRGIELTRSRPYRKNDQAWIEQKNGAIVRKLLGYRRLPRGISRPDRSRASCRVPGSLSRTLQLASALHLAEAGEKMAPAGGPAAHC